MPLLYNIAYCNNTVVIKCSVLMDTENLQCTFGQYISSLWEKLRLPDLANMCAYTPGLCQWLGLCLSTCEDA